MAKKKRNHSAASPSAASATTTGSNNKEPPIIGSKKQHKKKKQKKRHNNDVAAGTNNGAKHVGSSSSSQTRSLVSRLKKLRGTMASTPTPPEWSGCQTRFAAIPEFLTPENDADFNSCWKECYQGFYWETPEQLPLSVHESFDSSFASMHKSGLFLYDAVQPGGKWVTYTNVTRTLVGCPGSTYRYLGLRLFSHPWCHVNDRGDALIVKHENDNETNNNKMNSLVDLGYTAHCASGLLEMGRINSILMQRSQDVLQTECNSEKKLVGSADFSLTLINRMEPLERKRDLKQLALGGKTSVGWHKDSGLQDFSTIAVYHSLHNDPDPIPPMTTIHNRSSSSSGGKPKSRKRRHEETEEEDTIEETNAPWRVALRVAKNPLSEETRTPALSVPLPSGALYYLLDDFNHQHEHAVLAGSNTLRYSSTHRVAREGQGTWQYIRDKCHTILDASFGKRNHTLKETKVQQQLWTEIEFEWLRQWGIQGKLHRELHAYWHKPMEELIRAHEQLQNRTTRLLEQLKKASTKKQHDVVGEQIMIVSEDLFDVMIEAFSERLRLRTVWDERYQDPLYASMPLEMKPFECPPNINDETLDHLKSHIANLRSWRASFVTSRATMTSSRTDGHSKHHSSTKKKSGLTKTEQKKIASNWESMKLTLTKKSN